MKIDNKWFPFGIKKESPITHRVFCFYYAGGSSAVFKEWIKPLSPGVDFIPVELPGRGKRAVEPCYNDFDLLVDELVINLAGVAAEGIPFSFFGHSMGASIAFEAACKLKKNYGCKPERLIVAGRHAPHKPDPSPFKSYHDDKALIAELHRLGGTPKELLENDEILQYILPMIRSDYKLHENYTYKGDILPVPIIAHSGTEDYEADKTVMSFWEHVTTGGFEHREYPGNHFFVQNLGGFYVKEIISLVASPGISKELTSGSV